MTKQKNNTADLSKRGFFNDVRRFLALLGKNRLPYAISVTLFTFTGSLSGIVEAEALRNLMGYLLDEDPSITIWTVVILVAAAFLYSCVIQQFLSYYAERIFVKINAQLRKDMFEKLQTLPVSYFHGTHSGEVITRINGDIQAVINVANQLWGVCWTIFGTLTFLPYIALLDWRMSIIVAACGVLSAVLTAKVVRPLREKYKKIREAMTEMSMTTTESVTGFNVTKMYSLQDKFSQDFAENVDSIYETQRKYGNMEALIGFCRMAINFGGNAVSVICGVIFAAQGSLPVSSLAALTDVCRSLIHFINNFAEAPANLQREFASIDRLFDIAGAESEPERYDIGGYAPDAGVMIKDMSFEYNPGVLVLDNISIIAQKGEKIALVGDSGSGKTTLMKLLSGLYPPQNGEVVLDGKALGEYSLAQMRELIAYVPQDAYIFNGSIEENIAYGRANCTFEDVKRCAKDANAESFILTKPDGYATQVGERGIQLSGGERQRIAIARAMLKDAPILLLDEATSSLDSESELLIQATLERLMEGRTSVVVAHRLSTIVNSDRIYMMREGKVIGIGRHDELLDSCPEYRELYQKKFAV